MRIELLVVPDCPHEAAAAELLTAALEDVGLESVDYTVTVVDTQADADQRHFLGSPTFSLDGHDLFPEAGRDASIACRLYAGPGGLPQLRDLRQALKRAATASAAQR
jgi:hypothetical protein